MTPKFKTFIKIQMYSLIALLSLSLGVYSYAGANTTKAPEPIQVPAPELSESHPVAPAKILQEDAKPENKDDIVVIESAADHAGNDDVLVRVSASPEAPDNVNSMDNEVYEFYKLAPGDVLDINVFNEDELSDEYAISNTGVISMPLVGEVYIEGLTVLQAQEKITQKLADGYLMDPSVSIELEQKRSFYILGEVRAPGSYDYVNNISILNAVAMAGGFTYRADQKDAKILRQDGKDKAELDDIPVSTKIVPGDIIVIEERFF